MNSTATIHPFESAGLGVAPFRFIGVEERRGPMRMVGADGIVTEVGAPGQPLGCCAYCYTGIAFCYSVRSSDGRTFIVGSECIRKVGDAALVRSVQVEERKAKKAREADRIAAARSRLDSDLDLRRALAAKPTPLERRRALGETLYDWADWMLNHAGNAGKLRAARVIERH